MKLVAKPEGNGDWMVVDTSMPKTEAFYYGMVAHRFASREEAELWAADCERKHLGRLGELRVH
jgi:hypothetical protein